MNKKDSTKRSLNGIDHNSVLLDEMIKTLPGPFWDPIDLPDDPFFGSPKTTDGDILFLSGPSRNGNHLIHSLLDGHPALPRVPGEDSVSNTLFKHFREDYDETINRIQSDECPDLFAYLSGRGRGDKWKKVFEFNASANNKENGTDIWSGMFYGRGEEDFVFDYQDTKVEIDYPSYQRALKSFLTGTNRPDRLIDQFVMYAQALSRLDPDYPQRSGNMKCHAVLFGSGVRGTMNWMMERSSRVRAIVPIRPFQSYYYSFSKGFFNTTEIRDDLLKEAWEHWWHKAVDYVILKHRFPNQVCIVNFEHLIKDQETSMQQVCDFLGIEFDPICLKPTVFGRPTKGNSSRGQSEDARGKVYQRPLSRQLDDKYVPEEYFPFWENLKKIAL